MKNKNILLILFVFGILIFLTSFVSADSHLPANLLKILDYNKEVSENIALKVSFFVAFVAGALGILSPCILPFLPAYFSYTFKEKKNITFMTLIFFFGFSLTFIVMGIIAGFVGAQAFNVVQADWLMVVAGVFILGMGLLSLSGRGFSSIFSSHKRFGNDLLGTFLFGIFFALGWSACLGPILAGILGIGALLHDMVKSALLLFFYSLGNAIPLFVLAIFYDKFNLGNTRFVKGKMLNLKLFGKNWEVHSTNLISGIIFSILGLVIIIFRGTSVVNTWDFLRTKDYFYSTQEWILNWRYTKLMSVILFLIFVLIVGYVIWSTKKKKEVLD
tara:strand:- start:6628 stop:7617 length:990 start_codon:yes stop_codon:yes gene_type:complete